MFAVVERWAPAMMAVTARLLSKAAQMYRSQNLCAASSVPYVYYFSAGHNISTPLTAPLSLLTLSRAHGIADARCRHRVQMPAFDTVCRVARAATFRFVWRQVLRPPAINRYQTDLTGSWDLTTSL